MPQLREILNQRKSTFKKKNYRPWDLSGDWQTTPIDPLIEKSSQPEQPQIDSSLQSVQHEQQPLAEQSSDLTTNSDNNAPSNRYQLDNNKISLRQHKDNNQITKRQPIENIKLTKRQHLDNTLDNKSNNEELSDTIKRLSGHQQAIFFYIVQVCTRKRESSSGPLNTYKLAEDVGCSYLTAKMCLKRLVDKQLLIRKAGKRAKGGFIEFEITIHLQVAALSIRNQLQMHANQGDKSSAKQERLDNILDNKVPYSSSNNINTTTGLPAEWLDINFDHLREIGFSITQLTQLYEKKLNTPEIIQESINHFAYALKNNPKKINAYADPLNVLMGVLRKGQAWIENNYEPPHVQAMRDLIARKKAEKEQENVLEKELITFYYQDWKAGLTEEQKEKILPRKIIGPEDAYYKTYFIDNFWVSMRAKVLGAGT